MKEQVSGQQPNAGDTLRLFVYGTLRRGGLAEHYLEDYPLIESGLRLPGYVLYDAGWYPFAVRADLSTFITGDLLEVPVSLMPVLDEYEGSEYVRHFSREANLLLYLKKNEEVSNYPSVPDGDWLKYWKRKNI